MARKPTASARLRNLRRAAGLLALLGAVTSWSAPPATAARPDRPQSTLAHPSIWPAGAGDVLIDAKTDRFVDALLAKMTLEEKVGQMVQADIASVTPDEVARYHLGSVLAGGNAAPGGDIRVGPRAWLDLIDAFDRAALSAKWNDHAPIPIIFGIDAVHGDARIPGATVFPHNIALGAAHDPDLIRRIGEATAQETAASGVDWAFAPTIAVVRDVRWGRSYESYSESPALVARYAAAMVTGLQGRVGTADFMAPGHVLASAKHFLGDGGTLAGRDQGDNLASESTLRDVHGAGYPAAIAAGTATIMASYNGWRGVKMHGDRSLLTGVLKQRMGFNGFVVGDWNAHEELPGCTKYACAQAINAGVDMIMAPDGWRQFYSATIDQVRRGEIPQSRIDDAVRRILRVKALAGLFNRPSAAARPGVGDFSVIGNAEHRALARQAVRESLVLLKNQDSVLPLRPGSHILVAGEAADDIGRQSGGWTVDWQGAHNSNAQLPGATSIFAGIKAAVAPAGGEATFSPDGHFDRRPDAAIVVFGETPYAEFVGDRETVEFSPADSTALTLLRRLKAQHIPVVAVFLSGRPMWINRELNAADALVAAWLPGSEGEGVADVLFARPDGQPMHDFTGRLGFSWPATGMPATFDAKGSVHGVLFPVGYGLTYAQAGAHGGASPPLSEDPEIPPGLIARDSFFHAGHVTAPWSIYVSDPDAEVRLTMENQLSPGGDLDTRHRGQAIEANWKGGAAAVWRIGGGGRKVDLSGAVRSGLGLSLTYRTGSAPSGPVTVGMGCGPNCVRGFDVASQFGETPAQGAPARGAPARGWRTLTIPLTCLAARGADLTEVEDPVVIKTAASFRLEIREARLAPAGRTCPSP